MSSGSLNKGRVSNVFIAQVNGDETKEVLDE